MEKGTESPLGVPNSGTSGTIAEPIPPLHLSLTLYVGGRSEVEAAKQAIRKADRVGAGKSKHEIRLPFDVLDSAMADFLRDYAPRVVKFDREAITPALVDFKLHHIEFEDLGKITLRKLSDAVTELSVDTPRGPTLLEAAVHLLKWEKNLSAQEGQALTDLARQIETQIDAGKWPIIIDNTHWFENLPSQERAEKLLLLQQKKDAACDELSEVRKRNQQQITQKFFARTRFEISDKLTVNPPAAQATSPEPPARQTQAQGAAPNIERKYRTTRDALERVVRDFTRKWLGDSARRAPFADVRVEWIGQVQIEIEGKCESPKGLENFFEYLPMVKLTPTILNAEWLKVEAWAMNWAENPDAEKTVGNFFAALIQDLDHYLSDTPTHRAPVKTQGQRAANESWQLPPEEPGMVGKPGSPGLPHQELIYRLAKAQEGEEVKAREPQKTWKEIAKQIQWKSGNNQGGIKLLEDARKRLKRATKTTLAEVADWRKKKEKK